MHRSTDRILTTHVGSLPRGQAVVDVLFARQRAEADAAANASVHAPGEEEAVIAAALAERGSTAKYRRPRCVGPIAVKDTGPLEADLHNLRAAVREAAAAEAFMNAASPGVVALFQPNDFYRTQDDYLTALAGALQSEYEAIVAAGILLQIDAPYLSMGRHTMYRNQPLEEFERLAARHIEVLNHALRNVPAER